jgi:acetylglutamate kinase
MLKVVKIGGNIVDNAVKLREFLADFASLAGDKILVHGGGKVATAISSALGIETRMINGRRVTDRPTLEVVTMVYAGINKQITALLQGFGCNAVGLCGADGALIVSKKRSPEPIDYGFVGDPITINSTLVGQLLEVGHTIVVAPITYDGQGGLLNTNADTVAQTIATAMAETGEEVELVYCFEKQGVLLDVNDKNSVVPRLDSALFASLRSSGAIHSGMLPKLENAFAALDNGVQKVVICAAENIAKQNYGGTTIVK